MSEGMIYAWSDKTSSLAISEFPVSNFLFLLQKCGDHK